MSYRAYRCHSADNGKTVTAQFDQLELAELQPGQVRIRAQWSTINYKDALACTGAGRIMKRFPLTAGIDVAGVVAASADPRFSVGADVLVVGCGLGEEHDGGYADYCTVHGDWIVALPAGLSTREAMAIGTAGFTAAMGIVRMEDNGLAPEQGPVLVNGATGGVGSLAVDMLAGLGYQVTALSGKRSSEDYLKHIGAAQVLWRDELQLGQRPLETALWAGAVDNLGGEALAWLTRTVQPCGSIASIGLAAGHTLNTTVMPFILRGVNLLGINSTYCPVALRERVWTRLAGDLKPRHLDKITSREVSLEQLPGVFGEYLQAQVAGRTVVKI